MGMKKSSMLGLMGFAMAMAATEQSNFEITKQGDIESDKPPKPIKRKEPTPFNKQEGVLKLISEYKLIQEGKSKKGSMKQARTIAKIKNWLDKGYLTEEDIN